MLDTGLRVSELAGLSQNNIDWQNHRLTIYGKGGPYGKKTKRRIIPMSSRIQPLLEGHFSLHDNLGFGVRTIQRIVKRIANHARISRPVTPHVLRHTFAVTCIQKNIAGTSVFLLHSLYHNYYTDIQANDIYGKCRYGF